MGEKETDWKVYVIGIWQSFMMAERDRKGNEEVTSNRGLASRVTVKNWDSNSTSTIMSSRSCNASPNAPTYHDLGRQSPSLGYHFCIS